MRLFAAARLSALGQAGETRAPRRASRHEIVSRTGRRESTASISFAVKPRSRR